jgi:hypothetical protein
MPIKLTKPEHKTFASLRKNVVHPTLQIKSVKIHEDGLPQEQTVTTVDPTQTVILAVAPPGWGKTEFFGSFPDNLMLCFEEGHKFVKGYKIIIDCWDYRKDADRIDSYQDQAGNLHMTLMQALDLIEESKRFKFITIDTVDSFVKMILDFFYEVKKVEHADELGEYGRGWDIAQNTPFRKAMNRLIKSGRGLGLTTHEQVNTKNFKSGQQSKKETTLPGGVWKYLLGQLDIVLHGSFGKRIKGSKKRERLIATEGTEDMLAKNRGGKLPPIYICDEGKQWQQFSGFFTDPETVEEELKRYEKIYGEQI